MFDHLAMWVWPEAIQNADPKEMADRLTAAHVDTIFPYMSRMQGFSESLQLQEERLHRIIEEAHKQDIKVHGCLDEMNAHEGMLPASIYALRQVFADGTMNGSLCPANPEAMAYILGRLEHGLTEFDYDGITLEDSYIFNKNTIYDPANNQGADYKTIPVCYCSYCKAHAPIEQPGWEAWKVDRLTNLVREEAEMIRRIKPGAPFSVAARMPYARAFYGPFKEEVAYYDGWEFCQSRDAFAADWAGWLKEGLLDFACPMAYFESPRMVELQTEECKAIIPDAADTIWMGLTLGTPVESWPHDRSVLNTGPKIDVLLNKLEEIGQKNCVFFNYEALLDEHIPVMASHCNG